MRLFAAALLCVLSAAAEEFPIGSRIAQLEVKDGVKTVAVSTSRDDATVLIFLYTQCHISTRYNERINDMYKG